MLRQVACLTASHDLRLLAIACAVCSVGSVATMQMLGRARTSNGYSRWVWVGAGGVAFGAGVWVTHFVAMLAYTPDLPIAFDVPLTGVSLLLAIVGGWCGLTCAISTVRGAAIVAGLLLGATIGAMHFTGMVAFQTSGLLAYDPHEVVAALVLGCVFAPCALLREAAGKGLQGALLLLLAVIGLHLTAMAAITIHPDGSVVSGVPTGSLAVATAAVGLLVLGVSLGSVFVDVHLEQRTVRENARLRRFAEATFEGLFFVKGGVVQDANSVLCRMLGLTREEIVGRTVASFFTPETRPLLDELHAQSAGDAEAEIMVAGHGCLVVDVLARPFATDDMVSVIAVRDASERKRAERRIQELVHLDPLTGLANRMLLRDRLTQALAVAERSQSAIAIFCLDLDRFKAVNDILGHHAGDSLLVEVGNRLRVAVRDSDTVARLGGDEFVIVQLVAQQPEAAQKLARRLVQLLAEPFLFEGTPIEVTASIGIAISPAHGSHSADTLLQQADLALYRAKREGRNMFRFFEPEMDLKLQAQREMERDLRLAIGNGELKVHYQPVFDGARLTVVGYEALLRWEHPTRGPVSPTEFIPLAEECGAIISIGAWVLEQACSEAASWEEPHTIAVNLSPVQIRHQGFIAQTASVLARSGLAPDRLELEITEGVLIEDTVRTLAVLTGLKDLGVCLALDDFGTGYSSLSYLRRFPFDRLKIDRSFVAELGLDADADALVQSIIAMSQSLRLEVTAEGVETREQMRILREMGLCNMQGYLLGKPAAADEIALICLPAAVLHAVHAAEPSPAA